MGQRRFAAQWVNVLAVAGLVGAALVGCSSGDNGSAGPSGVAIAPVQTATALTITVTSASVSSPPVVNFRMTNQDGASVTGLTDTDFRFNIAKLVPGTFGNPYNWQDYLNRVQGGAVVGTQERKATGSAWGNLVSHGDGTYTYTFATDITAASGNPCPAPCTDAAGNALDISYQPGLTHRVGIQLNNTALPRANGTYDFVPAGGAVFRRDIVRTEKCNECHNRLAAHGGGLRVETKLCVTCHNPGSWDNSPGNVQTLDFKVMIHKIHRGEELPSVVAGGTYAIGNADFSTVVFPQPIDNCTKCHDGADPATPQGDNWKNQPSREACGSCHDNVNFATGAGHPGGIKDNSTCLACHSSGGEVGPIADSHSFPARLNAAADRFKFTVLDATPTGPGDTPTLTFKIEKDGVGLADFRSDPAFTGGGASTLNIRLAWSTRDIGNAGSGQNYGQPATINLLTAASVAPGATAGTYTVTGSTIPVGTTGSLRVFMDGHPAGDVTTPGTFTDRLPTKSVFKDFKIDDATVVARRSVVDIAKCDGCHRRLSLHGNNRTDEPGVCVNCHNPNATDKSRRTGVGVDGKTEESIDFKRMIHAIHAGQRDDPSTTTVIEGYGFREKGIVVYGFGGSVNDFSDVRFPGILSDCSTCHLSGSYELSGRWEEPDQSGGILGSTVDTSALTSDASDDLKISQTAAVCSACHDGSAAKLHIEQQGGLFSVTQTAIGANFEPCSVCHGPGRLADVKVVHGVR
ncbi:MAG: OmcA/MtrC family decaheme c-type cytochrome [Burkholderiales bacterium]